jgi:hypothetical protein
MSFSSPLGLFLGFSIFAFAQKTTAIFPSDNFEQEHQYKIV